MMNFEEQLNSLLERTKNIKSPINAAPLGTNISEYNAPSNIWMDDVQIFYSNYLKNHALGERINTLLFHRKYNELVSALTSVSNDRQFIDKMNGVPQVSVAKYQAKMIPEYDVFISHANKDKEDLVEELYKSLNKLGVTIFMIKNLLNGETTGKIKFLMELKKQSLQLLLFQRTFLIENGRRRN